MPSILGYAARVQGEAGSGNVRLPRPQGRRLLRRFTPVPGAARLAPVSSHHSAPITTALVLAGGRGERLRPLTDDRPKPMAPIDGVPLLHYHLAWLRAQGVTRAVLLAGYRHDVIEAYFAEPRIAGLTVETVVEQSPLGRGGAIRHGFEKAGVTDDLVVATNGDVLTDQPLAPIVELHRDSDASATIMLTPMVSPYGVVDVEEGGKVTGFREAPVLPHWINAGVYVLAGSLVPRFPAVGDHEASTFPELAQAGKAGGIPQPGFLALRRVVEGLARGGRVPERSPRPVGGLSRQYEYAARVGRDSRPMGDPYAGDPRDPLPGGNEREQRPAAPRDLRVDEHILETHALVHPQGLKPVAASGDADTKAARHDIGVEPCLPRVGDGAVGGAGSQLRGELPAAEGRRSRRR